MKKIVCHISLIALTLLLSSSHCRKSSSPSLPPVTQKGANTFGCLVDGKAWIPHYPCKILGNPCSEMVYDIFPSGPAKLPLSVNILVTNDAGDHTSFTIAHLGQHFINGAGNIADSLQISFAGSAGAYGSSHIYYRIPGMGSNNFTITRLDTTNNIISGTFELTLYANTSTGVSDSVMITEGRFDLRIGQFCNCSH